MLNVYKNQYDCSLIAFQKYTQNALIFEIDIVLSILYKILY